MKFLSGYRCHDMCKRAKGGVPKATHRMQGRPAAEDMIIAKLFEALLGGLRAQLSRTIKVLILQQLRLFLFCSGT